MKVASMLGYNWIATSPFLSGLMMQVPLPTQYAKANYMGAKHLNFVRSLPYSCLKSVAFGAKNNRHLKTNLTVAYLNKMEAEDYEEMFLNSATRKQVPETEII
jgi:hypothetical protein